MKKVLGILRGFPGLGRVVAGVSLIETLREKYGFSVKIISYLQGNKYLESRGYKILEEATPLDYCSIGLVPTNKMGRHINSLVKAFEPDAVIIDGEPLILHSLKISYPKLKVISLLNPADVENPQNDPEAMDYFNALYAMSDLAIIHGLKDVKPHYNYSKLISTTTILRNEILSIRNDPTNEIYCVLGGGTVNVGHHFAESTIMLAELCQEVADLLPKFEMNIICSSQNIFDAISENETSRNVHLYNNVVDAQKYYRQASLIITRSGRNTLSEIAYLGIPAITFISGCQYRKDEQIQNVKNIHAGNITMASMDITIKDFANLCIKMINKGIINNSFDCGNQVAIDSILELLQ